MPDIGNAIKIENLDFSFNEKILNNINLNIKKGKFYSILGPNGSGKTTLLRLISKILNKDEGKIFIEEKSIDKINLKELAKKLAVVPQNTDIEFEFTVKDIVLMGRAPHISRFSSESKEDIDICTEAMKITGTWQLRDKSINALSGGERQRVIVARSIAQNTEIILLDEPISHLDIRHQIDILNEIKSMNVNKNVTIVAVLHDINLAAAYSDELILMKNGTIYNQGTPENIIREDIIKEVYDLDVYITKNPLTDKPFIMPVI